MLIVFYFISSNLNSCFRSLWLC